MRKTLIRSTPALCAALGALALAGSAVAQPEERNDGRKVTATLDGKAAGPEAGDPNGAGLFEARVDTADGRLCYSLSAGNIGKATGAYLHKGGAGEAGDAVLTLDRPDGDDEDSEECQDIDPALAQSLLADPADYYVSVRTDEFPNGAVRGQLSG